MQRYVQLGREVALINQMLAPFGRTIEYGIHDVKKPERGSSGPESE